MIGTFGKRPDGANSEGIKIQVPMGTDVRAVEGYYVLFDPDGTYAATLARVD